MNGNEGHWGGGIFTISQNFPKSPSIIFYPLESSISQTSPKFTTALALSMVPTVAVFRVSSADDKLFGFL
jgi:hypothetical protein